MQENNFIESAVVVGVFFLDYLVQCQSFFFIEYPSNDFVGFKQFLIDDTKLIPSNTQHFFHENQAGLPMLKDSQVVPSFFFIISHCMIQKTFSWLANIISHLQKRRSRFFSFSSHGTQFPCFWINSRDFERYEIAFWVTLNVSKSSSLQ